MEKIIEQQATYEVKGTSVTFLEKLKIDEITKEEIFDPKLEQENDVRLYNEYRKIKGLLLPDKIKKIRQNFGVTQIIFAKVLGLGDKTIAKFILKYYNYDKMKEMITHLKLQKLLNYVYSYLLTFEYKIFDENPQAWAHGPVFKSVYDEYSSYSYKPIDIPEESISLHEKELEKFILKIVEGYGRYSANAKVGEYSNEIILDSDIKSYFKELLSF